MTDMPIVRTSREEIEVYRFGPIASVLIPIMALVIQAFVPVRFRSFAIFDLPLLVTVFFAVARRSQVAGLLTGAIIGLIQDALTHQAIGLYGVAKTVVGYGASSLGVKIDVENPGTRLLVTGGFYLVHQAVYFLVARNILGVTMEWLWVRTLLAALLNGVAAIVLFAVLDRFKHGT
ncbi:MAG TPA: rod shape-determining protein MreD [Terriglobales bacterium]|nr:rod shape-determining protein MreD [Terriglobales bacterium]